MATMYQFDPARWLEEQGWTQYDPLTHVPYSERPIGGDWHFRKQAGRVVSEARVTSDGSIAVRCPECRVESFSREDARYQFCVRCGWHAEMKPAPLP